MTINCAAAAELRLGSSGQQSQPYVLRAETRGSDQGRVALFPVLSAPLEVQVGAGIKQHVNEREFLSLWQRAFKQHIRNKMERMGEARLPFSPADEFVGTR
jgi:hypothetical protein